MIILLFQEPVAWLLKAARIIYNGIREVLNLLRTSGFQNQRPKPLGHAVTLKQLRSNITWSTFYFCHLTEAKWQQPGRKLLWVPKPLPRKPNGRAALRVTQTNRKKQKHRRHVGYGGACAKRQNGGTTKRSAIWWDLSDACIKYVFITAFLVVLNQFFKTGNLRSRNLFHLKFSNCPI